MDGKPVPFVLFKTEAPGLNLYITETGLTYLFINQERQKDSIPDRSSASVNSKTARLENSTISWERVDMLLEGATIKKENVIAEKASANTFNYYYAHCPDGINNVKAYENITIKNIYPGIDWVLYNKQEQGFKYDFIVHPGADPKKILLIYRSLNSLQADQEGNLNLALQTGSLTENAPYSYLLENKVTIASSFEISSQTTFDKYKETRVTFSFNTKNGNTRYDLSKTLVIDPQLTWTTYYGGSTQEEPLGSTTDNSDNLYITGTCSSVDFPVQSSGSYLQAAYAGQNDSYILKFSASGALLWSTYYGGSKLDMAGSIATDPSGNVFIGGITKSPDLPLQNAGTYFHGTLLSIQDIFFLKFNSAGMRVWATYYGVNSPSVLLLVTITITVDLSGNLVGTGSVPSGALPVQSAGTYFQGTGGGLAEAFILKFDNSGNRLWATYYGGNQDDIAYSLTTDPNGNIFVVGTTTSPNFPVQNAGSFFQGNISGMYDLFILKFTSAGARLWATFYGGSNEERDPPLVGCDQKGDVYITGTTASPNFPLQAGSVYFQAALGGGLDAFILKLDNSGTRLWATYFGGSGPVGDYPEALAVNSCGDFYISFEVGDNSDIIKKISCDGGFIDSIPYKTGFKDYLVTHFSASGELRWSSYSPSRTAPFSISGSLTLDKIGNLYMIYAGSSDTLTVNPGGNAFFKTVCSGAHDICINKFVPGSNTTTMSLSYPLPACITGATLAPSVINFISGGTYTASGGLLIHPATGEIPTASAAPGIYTVSYLPAACNCITQVPFVTTITLSLPATLTINDPPALCGQSSAILEATLSPSTGASYTWTPGNVTTPSVLVSPGVSTAYSISVTDGKGCRTGSLVQVNVFPSVPPVTVNNPVICKGNSATLTANSGVTLNYVWLPEKQTSASIVLSPTATSIYSVLVSVGNCSAVIPSTITVTEFSNAIVNFSYPTPLCLTSSNARPDTAAGFSGGGSFASMPALNIDPLTGVIDLTGASAGSYLITYSVATLGCKYAGSSSLSVTLEAPSALDLPSKVYVAPGGSAVISVRGGSIYSWSPQNGLSCTTCEDPTVFPSETSLYCVSSTNNNCVSKACVLVEVSCSDGHDFSIPNAFTPNGDGRNEAFCLQGWDLCIQNFSVIIFNRWGEKVFESSDPDFCWDGIYKGRVLESDVYTYSIKASYLNEKNIFKKGNITLLR